VFAGPGTLHSLENGGTGENQVSSVRSDTGVARAPGPIKFKQAIGHGAAFAGGHAQPIDPGALICG